MKPITFAIAILASTTFAMSTTAYAQTLVVGQNGQTVVVPGNGMSHPMGNVTIHAPRVQTYPQPGYVQPQFNPGGSGFPSIGQPQFIGQPITNSYPVIVTPNEVTGFNPQTGGFNTTNQQIDNTAFDPYREQSKQNGSMQFVQRPIYDQFGNSVGYQEGYVWNNSVTGQEHGQMTNYTPNNNGGMNVQHQTKSMNRPNNTQQGSGIHIQGHAYSNSSSKRKN